MDSCIHTIAGLVSVPCANHYFSHQSCLLSQLRSYLPVNQFFAHIFSKSYNFSEFHNSDSHNLTPSPKVLGIFSQFEAPGSIHILFFITMPISDKISQQVS